MRNISFFAHEYFASALVALVWPVGILVIGVIAAIGGGGAGILETGWYSRKIKH